MCDNRIMETALRVEGLKIVRQNKKILSDISFSVKKGQIIGLFGPSGAGKTTLIRSIIGLQNFHHGQITVIGLPAGSLALRSQLGYMSQNEGFYTDLTVQENLEFFASILNAAQKQVSALLSELKLSDYRHQLVENLSGGQQARVSLAIALLGSPQMLFLDEPTVGLDPVLRRDLWDYFRQLAGNGVTMLISSHVMEEAANCDEVLLLRRGRILDYGPVGQLLKQAGAKTMDEAFLKIVEAKR